MAVAELARQRQRVVKELERAIEVAQAPRGNPQMFESELLGESIRRTARA